MECGFGAREDNLVSELRKHVLRRYEEGCSKLVIEESDDGENVCGGMRQRALAVISVIL